MSTEVWESADGLSLANVVANPTGAEHRTRVEIAGSNEGGVGIVRTPSEARALADALLAWARSGGANPDRPLDPRSEFAYSGNAERHPDFPAIRDNLDAAWRLVLRNACPLHPDDDLSLMVGPGGSRLRACATAGLEFTARDRLGDRRFSVGLLADALP